MPLRRFEEALEAEGIPLGVSYPVALRPRALPQRRTSRPRGARSAPAATTSACSCRSPSTPRPRRRGSSTASCWPIATACCASPRPPRASTRTPPRSWRRCRSAPARDGTPRAARLRLGRRHARARRCRVRRTRSSGVANHRLESAQRFAAEHGIERVTTDWRELVSAPDVDVVVVCTPNALHARAVDRRARGRQARALREADGDDASPTARRCSRPPREHDRLLLVLHPWRHHPAVIAVRDAIVAGELGRVVRTHGYGVHADWGPSGWFTDPALAGGGALVDMGIHAIDTARFLLGEPEARARARLDHDRARQLRRRRRRPRADRVGGRRALARRVGLVAAAPRRPRGRHRGLRQRRLPAHLGARAAARATCTATSTSSSRRCATRSAQIAAWQPGNAVAGARARRAAHLRAGVRGRGSTLRPCRLTARSSIAGIAGSLRRGSFNRGLLRAAVESAPGGMTIETLEIRDLPLYDADLDVDGGPEVVRAFKARHPRGRRPPHRDARVQLLDAGRAQERARLGLARAGARAQRQARRDRRRHAGALGHGAQPARAAADAAVPGLPRDAVPGDDDRRRARALRRRRQPHRRRDARAARRRARGLRDLDPPGRRRSAPAAGFLDFW